MYLHYIHIGKNWFYWFDEFKSNKAFCAYNGDGYVNKKYTHFAENISKSKAKKILQAKFPDYELILNYMFHEGHKIGKEGSRPIKVTDRKDNNRKIRRIMKGD